METAMIDPNDHEETLKILKAAASPSAFKSSPSEDLAFAKFQVAASHAAEFALMMRELVNIRPTAYQFVIKDLFRRKLAEVRQEFRAFEVAAAQVENKYAGPNASERARARNAQDVERDAEESSVPLPILGGPASR